MPSGHSTDQVIKKRIIDLARKGFRVWVIANRLGVSHGVVSQICKTENIKTPGRRDRYKPQLQEE